MEASTRLATTVFPMSASGAPNRPIRAFGAPLGRVRRPGRPRADPEPGYLQSVNLKVCVVGAVALSNGIDSAS
jgi:hypothetical protein